MDLHAVASYWQCVTRSLPSMSARDAVLSLFIRHAVAIIYFSSSQSQEGCVKHELARTVYRLFPGKHWHALLCMPAGVKANALWPDDVYSNLE